MKHSPIHSFLKKEVFGVLQNRKNVVNRAVIMAGARVLGLAFGAIGSVWAARCLGPRNLGISGMVQNIVAQAMLVVGIVSPTVLVRDYKNAEDTETKNKIIQSTNGFFLLLAFGFCVIAGLLMGFKWIPVEYHFAGWFFLPILLFTAIQPTWIFQAEEKQHFQSIIAVLQPALGALIYFVWFKPGMSAGDDLLVYSFVAFGLIIIYWQAVYKLTPLKGPFFRFDLFKDVKDLILRSRWLFVSMIAIYVYTTLEQPLLGWLYSVEELGEYRTAVMISNAANSFLMIIPMILYPRFLEWRKIGEDVLWRRQLKLTCLFLFVSIVGLLFLIFLVPVIYPLVFGENFKKAAIPCVILLASKFSALLNSTFLFGLMTDHRYDKTICVCAIGMSAFSLSSNLLLIPHFGMYAASIVNLLSEVFLIIIYASLSKIRLEKLKMINSGSGS